LTFFPYAAEQTVIPETEPDLAYGGDAYTGMQQAAAQGANNTMAVYEKVSETNKLLQTKMDTERGATVKMFEAIHMGFGILLLAIGLLTIVKYLKALVTEKTPKVKFVPTPEVTAFAPAVGSVPMADVVPPMVQENVEAPQTE
ncbi:MAG: hypothetical protein IKT68_06075, partial [Clostridia bacterium]|nr:hypothetical protein [Clostridia bacterium]